MVTPVIPHSIRSLAVNCMSEMTPQPPGIPFLWLLIIYSLAWAALQPGSWLLRGSVPGRQAPLCKYLLNLWVWHTHWCLIGQNKSHDPRVKVGGSCSRSCIAKGVVHWGPSMLQFTMFTLHCHTFWEGVFFFLIVFQNPNFVDEEGGEEEDASFIVYCVPGCSSHIYDSWKKSEGQNYSQF